jgi:hypothetical protein
MAQNDRAVGLGLGGGVVARTVVDDDDVEPGSVAVDLAHHAADHPLLVVGGDDRKPSEVGGIARHLRCESASAA